MTLPPSFVSPGRRRAAGPSSMWRSIGRAPRGLALPCPFLGGRPATNAELEAAARGRGGRAAGRREGAWLAGNFANFTPYQHSLPTVVLRLAAFRGPPPRPRPAPPAPPTPPGTPPPGSWSWPRRGQAELGDADAVEGAGGVLLPAEESDGDAPALAVLGDRDLRRAQGLPFRGKFESTTSYLGTRASGGPARPGVAAGGL